MQPANIYLVRVTCTLITCLQDYRWMEYPARGRVVQHPGCQAVQTYRGHAVLSTLIRCGESTGGAAWPAREWQPRAVHAVRGVAGMSVRGELHVQAPLPRA